MAEIIALFIVCRNIGALARSHGLKAGRFQRRAVVLWFTFELVCVLIAAAIGLEGILVYLAAFVGALLSLPVSFNSVRAAAARRAMALAQETQNH